MAAFDRELQEVLLEADDDYDDEFESHYEDYEAFGDIDEPDPGDEFEFDGDFEGLDFGYEAVLSEAELEGLAYEYMSIQSEAELEEFLGKLFRRVGGKVSKLSRRARRHLPGLIRAATPIAKSLAAKAAPVVGSAIGSAILPGAGTAIGGAAGSLVGNLLGGEMEYASEEEAKLDLAKRVVNTMADTVTDAAKTLSKDRRIRVGARNAVRDAAVGAIRKNIPKKVRRVLSGGTMTRPQSGGAVSGSWVRRGRNIIVQGV